MKKILILAAAVLMAVSLTAGDDIFSYIPFKSASWKAKITVEGGNSMAMDQVVTFKGKKMKMEGTMKDSETGKDMKQVIVMTSDDTVIYFPEKKTGMKYSNSSVMNPEKIKNDYAKYRSSAVKTGSEKVNGVDCTVWEYEIKEEKMKMKVKEYRGADGFVYRSVSESADGDKTRTTSDVIDLKKNITVSDSVFTVPSDIELMDMDNMMGSIMGKANKEEKKGSGSSPSNKTEENNDEAASKAAQDAATDMMKGLFGQ